jgi:hypothetical protein
MAIRTFVRRVAGNRASRATYPVVLRACGVGAVLAGMLFVMLGYIDRPNIPESLRVAVHVLSFVVPALFLVGVVGFAVLCGSRAGGSRGWGSCSPFAVWGWA